MRRGDERGGEWRREEERIGEERRGEERRGEERRGEERRGEKHWEYNQPLFIAFLDLEKAFDRVGLPREELWMTMHGGMVGLPADLQITIKSTYKTNKSRVSTNIGSG